MGSGRGPRYGTKGLVRVTLSDSASKSTGHPAKSEFQINNKLFFSISISHIILGTYLY